MEHPVLIHLLMSLSFQTYPLIYLHIHLCKFWHESAFFLVTWKNLCHFTSSQFWMEDYILIVHINTYVPKPITARHAEK